MELRALQLPRAVKPGFVEMKELAKLVRFLREDKLCLEEPVANEFTSRPYEQTKQFRGAQKLPVLMREYVLSPNKCALAVRLVNNALLVCREGSVQYLYPPRTAIQLPEQKALDRMGRGQNLLDLTLREDQEPLYLAVSDFGDVFWRVAHTQYLFSQATQQFKQMSLFAQQSEIFQGRQEVVSAVFPPLTPNMVEFDEELVVSYTVVEEASLSI